MNNIVLIHGGFVDGSGWESVYSILKKDGYNVSVVQNPTISLEGDVTATKRILAAQDGPAILVGHSYGGAVITEAGNDPKVVGLVYITAFAPDKGESVATLIKDPPPGAPVPPILPPQDGYLFLDREKFRASFAADVDAEKAAFMADSQVPWGVEALGGKISEPAWKAKPSWYLIAAQGCRSSCRTGRQECEDRRRVVTLGIAARSDPVLVAGCGVPEHCGPHCGSAVCAILLLTGGYITYPKSNNEVRIVSLATHKTASWQGNRVAILPSA